MFAGKVQSISGCKRKMENGKPLQKFWMSFLEMLKLLLSTIDSIRSGDWELLFERIRRILPYTFALDHISYALLPFCHAWRPALASK